MVLPVALQPVKYRTMSPKSNVALSCCLSLTTIGVGRRNNQAWTQPRVLKGDVAAAAEYMWTRSAKMAKMGFELGAF